MRTSTNIGYGVSIDSSAAQTRKRVSPKRCASSAETGCDSNWMSVTANRQSRMNDFDIPRYVVTYEIMNVFVKKKPAEPIVVAAAASTIGYHAVRSTSATGNRATAWLSRTRSNSGDSLTPSRTATPISNSTKLARNGRRQPHATKRA